MKKRKQFFLLALVYLIALGCLAEKSTNPKEPSATKNPFDSVTGKEWRIVMDFFNCDSVLVWSDTLVSGLCPEDFEFSRDSVYLFSTWFMTDRDTTRFMGDSVRFIWVGVDSAGRCSSTAFAIFEGVPDSAHWVMNQMFGSVSKGCRYGDCFYVRQTFDLVYNHSECPEPDVSPAEISENRIFWVNPLDLWSSRFGYLF